MQMMTMMKMKPQRPPAAAIIMFALETVKKTKYYITNNLTKICHFKFAVISVMAESSHQKHKHFVLNLKRFWTTNQNSPTKGD